MLNTYKYLSEALEALSPSVLHKMKKYIGQLDDYDTPFCEQQYTHGSLFKFKSFDQFNSPASNFRHLLSCGTIIDHHNFRCGFYQKALKFCENPHLKL